MFKVIGTGAAGNKAVINAIQKDIIDKSMALLINSTLRDIPEVFHDISIKIGGTRGGCGKEREVAAELTVASLQDGTLDRLDSLLQPNDETVIIVSSTEGGSGSGSLPVLAKYYKEIYGMNIHIILFTGFEDDARGLSNTVDLFRELSEDFTVQAISNKKFLADANGNRLRAQELANDEFARRLSIITGQTIVVSENNIDETDLFKVVNTPGYTTVESAMIDRNMKNRDQFNKLLSDMLDNSKSVDVLNPGTKRMAIILNIKESTRDNIDYSFDVIKQKYGYAFEVFLHIQDAEDNEEFVNVILSGMNLPIDEITEIHNKYLENMKKVNTKKDSFFDMISNLGNKDEVKQFNSARRTTMDLDVNKKKNFLNKLQEEVSVTKDEDETVDDLEARKREFINKNY